MMQMIMFPPNPCGFQERRWPLGEAGDEMEKEKDVKFLVIFCPIKMYVYFGYFRKFKQEKEKNLTTQHFNASLPTHIHAYSHT